MNMTDEDLAQSAAAGDRQAFCSLLERCYDRIFGLAFRLTGNRTEAEDLTRTSAQTYQKGCKRIRQRRGFPLGSTG